MFELGLSFASRAVAVAVCSVVFVGALVQIFLASFSRSASSWSSVAGQTIIVTTDRSPLLVFLFDGLCIGHRRSTCLR
jgi:hypothetical protein